MYLFITDIFHYSYAIGYLVLSILFSCIHFFCIAHSHLLYHCILVSSVLVCNWLLTVLNHLKWIKLLWLFLLVLAVMCDNISLNNSFDSVRNFVFAMIKMYFGCHKFCFRPHLHDLEWLCFIWTSIFIPRVLVPERGSSCLMSLNGVYFQQNEHILHSFPAFRKLRSLRLYVSIIRRHGFPSFQTWTSEFGKCRSSLYAVSSLISCKIYPKEN